MGLGEGVDGDGGVGSGEAEREGTINQLNDKGAFCDSVTPSTIQGYSGAARVWQGGRLGPRLP